MGFRCPFKKLQSPDNLIFVCEINVSLEDFTEGLCRAYRVPHHIIGHPQVESDFGVVGQLLDAFLQKRYGLPVLLSA